MEWMNDKELEKFLTEEAHQGDLCLAIFCTKCDAQFELGKEVAALAVMMKTPFWDYVACVQSIKCPVCNKED